MAVDKLVDSTQLDADLTSVANAIRTKGGTSASLAFPADFLTAIAAIPTGGGSVGPPDIIQDLTLSQAVRAVQIDIPSGYDVICTLIDGEFASADWLYYGINQTDANNYGPKITTIQCPVVAVSTSAYTLAIAPQNNAAQGNLRTLSVAAAVSYIHLRGYSNDFKAGTRFLTFGGKYADM